MPVNHAQNAVLAKAVVRAANVLGLDKECLVKVLGCSDFEHIKTDMHHQNACQQRGLQLVRIYRALFVILGGDETTMKTWMYSNNRSIKAKPAQIIQSPGGLDSVLSYLERFENMGDEG